MIQKIAPKNTTFFLLLCCLLFITKPNVNAQTIVPQPLDGLEKLCAGNSFNEFYATFSYIDFPAGTTFVIELSDSQGSFASPIATTKLLATDVSSTSQTIKFAVPITIVGADTYSFRVKSSLASAQPSAKFKNTLGNTSFPIYFKEYEASFFINNKNDVAMLCAGGSLTLSINNDTPTVQASSPVNYTKIKYKWYKDDVAIAGQSSKDLVVNAPGKYYAEIDYGLCSDVNYSSNRVTVTTSGSGGGSATISSSLGNPFCAGGSGTVLTATSGNSYLWKKDGTVISGATTRSINATESGVYTVDVDFGGCKATGSIDLKSNSFNASLDVADEFKLKDGETVNASVTTDAIGPTYEWYLNNNLISGATTNSYLVTAIGTYKVKISQASGCLASKEFTFKVKGKLDASVIPNIVNLAGSNPYWNIPNEYKNASTKVMIISSNGDMVLDVVDYQGDWPQTSIDFKNVNPVYYYVIQSDTGEKKGSITVIK